MTFMVGELTLKDRLDALTQPGRDPREALPPPLLRSKALSLKDLEGKTDGLIALSGAQCVSIYISRF